jgi:hypothetical protein
VIKEELEWSWTSRREEVGEGLKERGLLRKQQGLVKRGFQGW